MTPRYALTDSVDLDASTTRVWQLLVEELGGAGRWWQTHHTFSARKSVDTVGAVSQVRVFPGGVGKPGPRIVFVARTVKATPNRQLVQNYTGNFRGVGTFTLKPLQGGRTRLAYTFDAEPVGWVRQLARIKDVGIEHSATTRAAFCRLRTLIADDGKDQAPDLTDVTHGIVLTPDGARLHVADTRPGTEEAIVLIHGWGSTHQEWDVVADTLRSENHRVVTVDLRGHGWSTAGQHTVAIDQLGQDLELVLDALTIPRATLVGHSGGGLVAVHLAAEQPDRVSGLALLGTAVKDAGASAVEIRLMGSRVFSGLLRSDRVAEKLMQQTMGPAREIPARRTIATALADTPPRIRSAYFGASRSVDLTAQCRAYTGPTIVLRGEEDQVVDHNGAAHTARSFGTTARTVRSAGHALPLEEPQVVLHAIRELLAESAIPCRQHDNAA